ncbi:uncharacterized protein [Dendrobates tinctorius]|uniref:uncharacterized protein n=1 Tax=Dendrobates tinctorius TaxID=92724 RepID=UPI003CCA0195
MVYTAGMCKSLNDSCRELLSPCTLPMGISRGLGPLTMYLFTEEGVSFQADNDMFLTSGYNGKHYLVQVREMKDLNSKFLITLLPNGKIMLKDVRDSYVSWADNEGILYLDTEKCIPDETCEFEVFHDGDRVLFKASNGLFVFRNFRFHGNVIEVGRSSMDDCCRFRTGMGDLYAPSFDISDVELHDISKIVCRPYVLKKETFVNKTDEVQSHDFSFSWEARIAETTQWENTWALDAKLSTSFSVLGFEGTITYNGHFQKIATVNRSIAERRSVTVDVPRRGKVTAQLVVSKMENVSLPFIASVRKHFVSGESMCFEEKGVWKGLVYDNITLETKQESEGVSCTAL